MEDLSSKEKNDGIDVYNNLDDDDGIDFYNNLDNMLEA